MSDRQPLKATFFALRRREGAGFLLPATVMVLVVAVLMIAAFIGVNWPFFSSLQDMYAQTGATPPETVILGMFAVFGWALVFLFFLYVLFAAYEAACLRWFILKERPGGWLGLSLAAPTWRVYSGYWIWFGINLVVSMVVSLLMTPLMFGVMGAVSSVSDPQQAMMRMLPYQIAQMVAQYGAMIFIGIRFAPAAATSIARRKFSFFHAWNVTKGRFWALFGSFLLIWSLVGILWIVFTAVTLGAAFSGSISLDSTAGAEEMQALFERMFTPEMLTWIGGFYVLSFFLSFFSLVLSYGVNARAVLAAIEEGKVEGVTPEMAAVFD